MHRIQKISAAFSLLAVAIVMAASGPVFAQGGTDDGTTSGSSSGSGSTSTTTVPEKPAGGGTPTIEQHHSGRIENKTVAISGPMEHATETEATDTEDSSSQAELHKKGADLVAKMRKEHTKTKKTEAEHKKACESHKQGLTKKFSNMVTNAQKTQDHITSILDKAVAYQSTANLTVANFDGLVATANTAKEASTTSIAALKDVTPTIDCNNVSVASDVATFKIAAQDTRAKLKDYRTAVKAVLHSLQEAKTPETTEGSAN